MKKPLVAGILGMVAVSAHAQSSVVLYNYLQPTTAITYAIASSGMGLTDGLYASHWTIGVYATTFTPATVNAAMAGDYGSGMLPNFLAPSSATAGIIPGYPGLFGPVNVVFPYVNNTPVTLVVVAYSGANYETSLRRAHSSAFQMTAYSAPNVPHDVGEFMPAFSGIIWPEPSTFALAALGGVGVWWFGRRRRA